MKSILTKLVAALLILSVMTGCATEKQESAMEWMQKQPNPMDP